MPLLGFEAGAARPEGLGGGVVEQAVDAVGLHGLPEGELQHLAGARQVGLGGDAARQLQGAAQARRGLVGGLGRSGGGARGVPRERAADQVGEVRERQRPLAEVEDAVLVDQLLEALRVGADGGQQDQGRGVHRAGELLGLGRGEPPAETENRHAPGFQGLPRVPQGGRGADLAVPFQEPAQLAAFAVLEPGEQHERLGAGAGRRPPKLPQRFRFARQTLCLSRVPS